MPAATKRWEDWTHSGRRNYAVGAPIAQLAEQRPFKSWVAGSSPAGRTKKQPPSTGGSYHFLYVMVELAGVEPASLPVPRADFGRR